MHYALESFQVRDIAKNAINATVASAAYKYTKEQIINRTEHDSDDITVRVSATAVGSTTSWAARKQTDRLVDTIADWLVARRNVKKTEQPPEVPTKS